MCLILSLHQKEKDERVKKAFMNIVTNGVKVHDDGVAIFALNSQSGETFHLRSMELPIQQLASVLDAFDIVNVHLRQGTAGELSVHNTHFWERNGWFFAHNGMVSRFSGNATVAGRIDTTQETKDTDSLQFFNALHERKALSVKGGYVNLKKLDKVSDETGLSGRCVFVHPASSKIIYYGDFQTYNLDNKAVLLCSTKIMFRGESTFMGFPFDQEDIIPNVAGDIDGLNILNYKTYKLTHQDDDRAPFSYNWKSYDYNQYHGSQIDMYEDDDDLLDYPPGTIEREIAKDIKKAQQGILSDIDQENIKDRLIEGH